MIQYCVGVPEEVRLQTLQSVMLLLPDENREALQCLLHFLNRVSIGSSVHQVSHAYSYDLIIRY